LKKTLITATLLAVALTVISRDGAAFHAGGVAACDGCHSMHGMQSGQPLGRGAGVTTYLLQGSDQSSTCLICHSASLPGSYAVSTFPVPGVGTPPAQLTPGGDFAYLQKNYSWVTSAGVLQTSPGDRHGHNIIALDYNYFQDATYVTAPGGSYPSANLSCISCHDPHSVIRIVSGGTVSAPGAGTGLAPIISSGSYGAQPTASGAVGVYRLLGGRNYQPKSLVGSYPYISDPFFAVAPDIYNRSESLTDVRVAYGQGVSEWCGNCHGSYHLTGSRFLHSVNVALGPVYSNNYNTYVMTGDLTGTQASSFTSLVPFQSDNSTDSVLLTNVMGSAAGPDTLDVVNCLSCHRAHASAWDGIMRWYFNYTSVQITVNGAYPGVDAAGTGAYGEYATGKTQAEYQQAMYGRPASKFAVNQKTLCDKCHVH
jgi:hypothetical protein